MGKLNQKFEFKNPNAIHYRLGALLESPTCISTDRSFKLWIHGENKNPKYLGRQGTFHGAVSHSCDAIQYDFLWGIRGFLLMIKDFGVPCGRCAQYPDENFIALARLISETP